MAALAEGIAWLDQVYDWAEARWDQDIAMELVAWAQGAPALVSRADRDAFRAAIRSGALPRPPA